MSLSLIPLRGDDLPMACQLLMEAKEWGTKDTTFLPPLAILNNPDHRFLSVLQDSTLIGVVGYQDYSPIDSTAEMFTGLVPERRNGLMFPNIVKAQIEYAFRHLNLRRLTMTTLVDSPSAKMADYLFPNGVKKEGIFHKARFKNGAYHDAVAYAVERENYV